MSDAFLAARPSAHAATDAPRPQRPPRRISHLFNDRDNVLDASLGDVSHASSSSTGEGDGSVATAPQSHAQRFVKGSTSVDTDVDRTPTRVSHRSTALQNRASKASLRKDWQGAGEEQPRQASQRLARATAYSTSPSGDDGGLSVSRRGARKAIALY